MLVFFGRINGTAGESNGFQLRSHTGCFIQAKSRCVPRRETWEEAWCVSDAWDCLLYFMHRCNVHNLYDPEAEYGCTIFIMHFSWQPHGVDEQLDKK